MNADEFDALVFVSGADPEYRIIKATRMVLVENRDMNFALLAISLNPNDPMWHERIKIEVARYEALHRRIRDAYKIDSSVQVLAVKEEIEETPVEVSAKPKKPKIQTAQERAAERIALRDAPKQKKERAYAKN